MSYVPPNPASLQAWAPLVASAVNELSKGSRNGVAVSAAHDVVSGEDVLVCDATSAAFDVNLPPAGQFAGLTFNVVKVDASANAVTVQADGAETISGAASHALASQWEAVTLFAYGGNWIIL